MTADEISINNEKIERHFSENLTDMLNFPL